jgi:hypothetical protein
MFQLPPSTLKPTVRSACCRAFLLENISTILLLLV